MKRVYRFIIIAVVLLNTFVLSAQQGQIDITFNPGTGANNNTQQLELLYDNSIFCGGDFTQFNGTAFKRLKRLAADGSGMAGWAPHTPITGGADGPVRASAVQPNGMLLIGGLFNTVNGVTSKNFARLDTSGIVDTSFHIGTGFVNEVTSIATDGIHIFVGGFFSSYKGVSVPGFVCLDMSGDIDTSWFKPSGFIAVDAIATAPGGQVYIGGSFTTYNGVTVNRLARLNSDGTLDTGFNTGNGVTGGNVQAMCVQPDGKLLISGSFTTVDNISIGRIARINTNGSVDVGFNAGTGAGSNVRAIAVQNSTGYVYIGGDFTTVHGVSRPRIARLLSTGEVDTAFAVGTGTNGTVFNIRVQPDGNVIICGNFNQFNGVTVGKIVRLIGDTLSILPVSLIRFEATISNNDILLKWLTAGETNNSHFVVERSTDNLLFQQIGMVRGAGNSARLRQYDYVDRPDKQYSGQPLYYRLKQVNVDGNYSFSKSTKVYYTASFWSTMTVYPNPAAGEMILRGIPPSGAGLYDITGKLIMDLPYDGSYPIYSFKPGLYYIKSEIDVLKLVIK